MSDVDCIVAGAGVVGLAIARALARSGREVVVLEAEGLIGSVTSSRNSEVIHAGIYYPEGSLKARFCVQGRDALYAYCAEKGVPHRKCEKLIVACTDTEVSKLDEIDAGARANGVNDLVMMDGKDALKLEPALRGVAALLSPSTGIIDSHTYMLALRGDAEEKGAALAFHAPVESAVADGKTITVRVGGAEPMAISCSLFVNSAGLFAPKLAASIDGLSKAHVPTAIFAKGSYFSSNVRAPFSRLIYPAPVPGALGIHLTFDLGGASRFGPDIEWLDDTTVGTLDYRVDAKRGEKFYQAIRTYWPALPDGALSPAYSGVRPKIGHSKHDADFVIQDRAVHGVKGLINLFGIESPGLTASLAIADYVAQLAAAA
jgi:L-2-hydroxyglutarate oxidase LhgO